MSQGKWTAALRPILRALLTRDSLEFLRKLIKGAREIYVYWTSRRAAGIYEVLEHHTTVELADRKGEVAVVEKRQIVRFLQDHVAALTDHAWGDGEIFAEYDCRPGLPVDLYKDGSRYTVLISLREAKSRGHILKFRIRRKILRGFLKSNECWETDVYHRTRYLSVATIFPPGRRCRRATITQLSTSKAVALGPEHFHFLPDGRQQPTWEIQRPRIHDRYSLKWRW